MPGRKPKPTQLKVLTGNPGKRALPENEPQPEIATPHPPEGLSKEALKYWPEIAQQLIDAQILTEIDKHALALYCDAFSRWIDANKKLQEFGIIVKSPKGYPTQSPYLQIVNKAFEQMKSILIEFGMTPSSRTRVAKANASRDEEQSW